jgi:Skp family chaperone for outer membrane proteins
MKNIRLIAVGVFFAALFSVSAFAQTAPPNKVFVIDTGAFADEKIGIKKFVAASKKLDDELRPRYTELENLATKYQESLKQFETLKAQYDKNPSGPVTKESVQQKADELAKMQIDFKRKEEDLNEAAAKRGQELLNPIRSDIYKAMDTFAKQKGYPIILDLVQLVETKLILAIGDQQVNVTTEFIQYFNTLPAGSAASN